MSRSISFSVSRRNSSAVFFQLLQFVFILDGSGRTQLTDLVVDRYQLLGQAHKRLVPFHFLLHLLQFRPQGQIPCLGLTAYADVPQILGTVPWVALTGTGAVALTAFAIIHGNDAPAKIAEILDLTEQLFPAQLQIAQWLVHSASYLHVCTHSDYRAKKEKHNFHLQNWRTPVDTPALDATWVERYDAVSSVLPSRGFPQPRLELPRKEG